MASPHDITATEAGQKTDNFQKAYPDRFKGGKLPKAEINAILNQPGCVELRYYFMLKDQSKPNEITVVFVGVDAKGNDLVTLNNVLKDSVVTCPPNCGAGNILNHLTIS